MRRSTAWLMELFERLYELLGTEAVIQKGVPGDLKRGAFGA